MRVNYKKMVIEEVEKINEQLKEQGLKVLYLSQATLYHYNKRLVMVPLDFKDGGWYSVGYGYQFKNNKEAFEYLDYGWSLDQLKTHLFDHTAKNREGGNDNE